MFIYKTIIHLRDTDATGVIYFTEQLRLALEAFEHFLLSKEFTLQQLVGKESPFLMPIVHAEADYAAALRVGDKIEVHLSVEKIGTTSFTMRYQLFKAKEEVGTASLVHVVVSKATGSSMAIPDQLLELLVDKR